MNKQELQRQQMLVNVLRLTPDENTPTVHGTVDGYSVIATPGGDDWSTFNESYWSFVFGVKKANTDEPLNNDDFQILRKESKAIMTTKTDINRLVVTVNGGLKKEKHEENLATAMAETIQYLQANGYVNSCENGHMGEPVSNAVIGGVYRNVCDNCYDEVVGFVHDAHEEELARKDNVFKGVIGALIGSLIGGAAIILFYKLGFVAAISGFIMAMATIKGYTLMGGKIDIKAIIIIAVIMIIATYLADRISWAMEIVDYFHVPFFEAFKYVHEAVEPSQYYKDLGILFLFVGLGSVPTLISAAKARPAVEANYKM